MLDFVVFIILFISINYHNNFIEPVPRLSNAYFTHKFEYKKKEKNSGNACVEYNISRAKNVISCFHSIKID